MPKNAARGPSGRKASRRATGKTKKKSVKSRAILGSKRKLARFGKEQKKVIKVYQHIIYQDHVLLTIYNYL